MWKVNSKGRRQWTYVPKRPPGHVDDARDPRWITQRDPNAFQFRDSFNSPSSTQDIVHNIARWTEPLPNIKTPQNLAMRLSITATKARKASAARKIQTAWKKRQTFLSNKKATLQNYAKQYAMMHTAHWSKKHIAKQKYFKYAPVRKWVAKELRNSRGHLNPYLAGVHKWAQEHGALTRKRAFGTGYVGMRQPIYKGTYNYYMNPRKKFSRAVKDGFRPDIIYKST